MEGNLYDGDSAEQFDISNEITCKWSSKFFLQKLPLLPKQFSFVGNTASVEARNRKR